jgi:hypothetical protein
VTIETTTNVVRLIVGFQARSLSRHKLKNVEDSGNRVELSDTRLYPPSRCEALSRKCVARGIVEVMTMTKLVIQ